MTMLSPHFSLAEFTQSQTAARMGLDNIPTSEIIERMKLLCSATLEPTRAACGPLIVSSGYRAPLVNWYVRNPRRAGEQPPVPLPEGGQHPRGEAADIVPGAMSLVDLLIHIHMHEKFDQLIFEFGWVHVSYRPRSPRGQTLIASRTKGGVAYASMSREQVLALETMR